MSRKTIEVDSDMIDWTLEELAKLILRLENPKKTRNFILKYCEHCKEVLRKIFGQGELDIK
jgi:hypothetical protein